MVPTILAWLAPVAVVIALIALLVALAQTRRVRRGTPTTNDIVSAVREGDTARALELTAARIADIERSCQELSSENERLRERQRKAISHAGVVRFDALNEQTGELSFALALLDDDRSGAVVTSINGRHQTRIYGKGLEQGASPVALSDEEHEAIKKAME